MHPGDREILNDFARTRAVTLDLLTRVPDELLPLIPASAEQTIGWEFLHMAYAVASWMAECMEDGQPGDLPRDLSKPALLRALHETRDRLLDYFERDDGEPLNLVRHLDVGDGVTEVFTGRDRVCYLTAHEVHHRGKAILALRQAGFTDVPFLPFDHPTVATELLI